MTSRFLSDKSPSSEVRRTMESLDGYDRSLWKQMAEQLGLQGLHIPDVYGGQGFGYLELAIAMYEMGRALLCAPYFSTLCLAANAILAAGSEAQKRALLPDIANGSSLATLALLEANGSWDANAVEMEARREDGSYRLSGAKTFVCDGQSADLIVVAARLAGVGGREGVALFTVKGDSPGLEATPVETLDLTRKQADLRLRDVAAERLGDDTVPRGSGADALERCLDLATIALAAECAGGAERCLEEAVEYAKERVQFARPIGSFQAIKHMCAELLLEVESAKAASHWAAWVADESPTELREAASIAKSLASDAYLQAAATNLQIHGGMGFTGEGDSHLFYRRAKSSEVLLGDPVQHRARLASDLGI